MRSSLRVFALSVSLLFSISSFATNWTFTGNGDWNVASNWAGGLIPNGSGTRADTIRINGTASTGTYCPTYSCSGVNNPQVWFNLNAVTLIVSTTGTFQINSSTQFANAGDIIVYGTMINRTIYQGYQQGSLTVYGLVINQFSLGNQGLITVNSGGVIRNEAGFNNTSPQRGPAEEFLGLIVLNGGTIINLSRFTPGRLTNNGGIITNSATITGNSTVEGNLNNAGTIAPGNSPGVINITGDYTATSEAIHNFEVGGTTADLYDRLVVGANATLGGALNVTLVNGFTPPATSIDLPIVTGTISGTFSSVNIPSTYALVYTTTSVVLRPLSTLPVSFVSLEARKEASQVTLTWKVQNEKNVARYEVEKSNTGNAFTKVGTVAAISLSEYRYADKQFDAMSFYRVKSIDQDGKFKYSNVLKYASSGSAIALKAVPTVVVDKVTIQHATAQAKSRLIITSIDGKLVRNVQLAIGVQQTVVDLSNLKAGAYVVNLNTEGRKGESIRIIKQ